jgi:hypothetical protein
MDRVHDDGAGVEPIDGLCRFQDDFQLRPGTLPGADGSWGSTNLRSVGVIRPLGPRLSVIALWSLSETRCLRHPPPTTERERAKGNTDGKTHPGPSGLSCVRADHVPSEACRVPILGSAAHQHFQAASYSQITPARGPVDADPAADRPGTGDSGRGGADAAHDAAAASLSWSAYSASTQLPRFGDHRHDHPRSASAPGGRCPGCPPTAPRRTPARGGGASNTRVRESPKRPRPTRHRRVRATH